MLWFQHELGIATAKYRASQVALAVKNPPDNAGDVRDVSSVLGWGRSPGGGHRNPLEYSCLENYHGQTRLTGNSPRGCNESDTTGVTEHIYTHPVHHTLIATSPETAFHEEITQFYFSTRWPILGVFSSFWDILLKIKL